MTAETATWLARVEPARRQSRSVYVAVRCARFGLEPEITAQLLVAGHGVDQVPIRYTPRTAREGKKISWVDGFEAVYTLLRCRIEARPR